MIGRVGSGRNFFSFDYNYPGDFLLSSSGSNSQVLDRLNLMDVSELSP